MERQEDVQAGQVT